jgi:hypothetical protein
MSHTSPGQQRRSSEPAASQAPSNRRWYHLRPVPRGRADVIGVNRTWWTVLWIVLIVLIFLPW